MVELVSGLVIFNVYAPFLKKGANEVTEKTETTENLKTPESTESIEEKEHRRREFAKLKFLQLLQQRVEKAQREGKMAIVCGDLNLTWRTADVHENGLYVKVIENCIAGNPAWSLSAKGAFLADLSKSLMPPCRVSNPSRLEKLTRTPKEHEGENEKNEEENNKNKEHKKEKIHWLRLGDVVKELDFELVLPWTEAVELLKKVEEMTASPSSSSWKFTSLWSLRSLRETTNDTKLWPTDDTKTKTHTPNEALEGASEF